MIITINQAKIKEIIPGVTSADDQSSVSRTLLLIFLSDV
jgi:hypothetical protein